MRTFVFAGVAAVSLGACATTPAVEARYYFPKAESRVQVTQAIACDTEKKNLIFAHSGSVTTAYSADRDRKQVSFKLSDVSGSWANGDNAFTYTDDGRLKTVNSSSTGKGEEIINAAIKLGGIALNLAGGGAPLGAAEKPCDIIEKHGGGKPINLTYVGPFDYASPKSPKPDPSSSDLYRRLAAAGATMPTFAVDAVDKDKAPTAAAYSAWDRNPDPTADSKVVPLKLTGHRLYEASLKVRNANGDEDLWRGDILVPEGQYALPIPKAAFFGKQTFGIALSEAGTITSLSYGTESGTAAGMNSLSAIGSAIQGPDDATKAAAAKGSADLIAQLNRLAACRAKPDTCV